MCCTVPASEGAARRGYKRQAEIEGIIADSSRQQQAAICRTVVVQQAVIGCGLQLLNHNSIVS
jgi:hypothetical protein